MNLFLQKTIRAKIVFLTKSKEQKLENEYRNFQLALSGKIDVSLYSATRQQAQRLLKRIKGNIRKEQPLVIRRDCFKIQEQENTKVSRWWAKIPIFKKSIWVAVELPKNQEPLLQLDIRECRLVREEKKRWSLRIVVQKEVAEFSLNPNNILSVDLGEKHIATTVLFRDGAFVNPGFYGERVRGLRRHYAWLRKRLCEKKSLDTIRKIKDSERRKVKDILHKISREIVDEALSEDACIVLGDLKGIRKRSKGRRMNRIVANMPYFKLSNYIEYKASWANVPVYKISEAWTSKTCHRCTQLGERLSQGLFRCPSCNLVYNADLNGAMNLAKRFFDYKLENGVSLAMPVNFPRVK